MVQAGWGENKFIAEPLLEGKNSNLRYHPQGSQKPCLLLLKTTEQKNPIQTHFGTGEQIQGITSRCHSRSE